MTGASSGIGESFARLLAGRGTDLVIVARRADLLDGLARELVERYRVAVEVVAADLTDPGQRAEVEGRLSADPVELLVNNAGYGAFAYVAAFSESLHAEVAAKGVHVTVLCPGFTRTEAEQPGEHGPSNRLWLRRDDVARAGLDAVSSGRALCVPGVQYKAAFPALKLVPRPLLRAAVNRMWQQAAGTR